MKIRFLKLKNWLIISFMGLLGLTACHSQKKVVDSSADEPPSRGDRGRDVVSPMYGVPVTEMRQDPPDTVESPREPQVTVYGVPTVDFDVKGRVVDAKGKPIRGMQVIMIREGMGAENVPYDFAVGGSMSGMVDTTDANGNFEVSTKDTPWENKGILVRDIDGAKNGLYESEVVEIEFGEPVLDGKERSRWYMGVKKADVTVKMKRKAKK
jgi:putative lipoprotein (rSAM/lipoprotein system)